MDPNGKLQDCLHTVTTLKEMLEQDREEISQCISGELLAAYLNGVDKAADIVEELRNCLLRLSQ